MSKTAKEHLAGAKEAAKEIKEEQTAEGVTGKETEKEKEPQRINDSRPLFDLNASFHNYLKQVKIDAVTLDPSVLSRWRHAYFGGMAQMYVTLAMEVPNMKDPELQQRAVSYIANKLNEYAGAQKDLINDDAKATFK